ncbi:hypothetical protein Prudu_008827 [Prunus dulcis]|uniref:Uncharacterized protein n=1 Tax=Prunus dulcis TaxID=3755 RepID=A0A4Y1R4Z7_PRUDU|nr:hypothetical protein Prudu_008827 [Prunus dulcis]
MGLFWRELGAEELESGARLDREGLELVWQGCSNCELVGCRNPLRDPPFSFMGPAVRHAGFQQGRVGNKFEPLGLGQTLGPTQSVTRNLRGKWKSARVFSGIEAWVPLKLRRRKRDFRQKFLVVLVAEVISGDSFVVVRTRLGEPTFEQFMYLYSVSKQQGNFGWVQANCRKANERGYFISHKPTTQKSWRNRWCMAYGDYECPPGKSVIQHISTHFQPIVAGIIRGSTKVAVDIDDAEMQKRLRESRAKKAEKGTGNCPRDDDEGRVADVLGKRKALEEAHQYVPPKLPFGMEDIFAEGVEKVDFGRLRQQKKEVNLAMHRQEVPLVNVFLEGVKSDPRLWREPSLFLHRSGPKTILTSAYAFGEMYVSMAKADKEIQRLKRRDEMAKSKMAEAQRLSERRTPCCCKRRLWPRRWRS